VQQVEAEDGLPPLKAAAAVYITTAALAADKTNLTTSLVMGLLAEIRRLRQQPVAKRPAKPLTVAVDRRPPPYLLGLW